MDIFLLNESSFKKHLIYDYCMLTITIVLYLLYFLVTKFPCSRIPIFIKISFHFSLQSENFAETKFTL